MPQLENQIPLLEVRALTILRSDGSHADTPMKRAAQPEEIAPAYVFLAAPSCSSYITGEILPIIGGYSGG